MNQHTPQEWADWTGCYVAQDKGGSFYMFPDKPDMCTDGALWRSDDFFVCIPEELVDIPADHHWTTLYEPRKADNAPHQSVKEYVLVLDFDQEDLAQKVSEMLNNGWSLYGNPFTGSSRFGLSYYQAMTRERSYEQDV